MILVIDKRSKKKIYDYESVYIYTYSQYPMGSNRLYFDTEEEKDFVEPFVLLRYVRGDPVTHAMYMKEFIKKSDFGT